MMIERRALRWTGLFGLASVGLWLAQLPLLLAGFTRVVLEQALYVTMLLYSINLRHLVVQAHPERESAGTLVVASMIVWLVVMLGADGLELGAVTATFLASTAYATFVTGVLPRWSAWIAVTGAVLCVASIPAAYFGARWGPAIAADLPPFAWLLCVSAWTLRRSIIRPRARAPVVGSATA